MRTTAQEATHVSDPDLIHLKPDIRLLLAKRLAKMGLFLIDPCLYSEFSIFIVVLLLHTFIIRRVLTGQPRF